MTRFLVRGIVIALAVSVVSVAPADAARPNTKITGGPKAALGSTTATFEFSSTKAGSKFKCKLDKGAWRSCTSPKKYTKLAQGKHKFRVVARKAGQKDKSPAKYKFRVDTVMPDTTVVSGPSAVTSDHTPTFTFTSNEPSTFSCRVGAAPFKPCSSPYTLPEVDDEVLVLFVRARDRAGNADPTPASRQFEVLTPITKDQATAEAAAELYFPNTIAMDVPTNCAALPVDCSGGTADPPADQLSAASTRTVVEVVGMNRYDVTVVSGVSTLQEINMDYLASTCEVTLTSAGGGQPNWSVTMPLNFVEQAGALRIDAGPPDVTGIESSDYSVNTDFPCNLLILSTATIESLYVSALTAHFTTVGDPLCAASGPAYLGPCPP